MEHNIKLVLKFLRDKDCIESFLTLERESGMSLTTYSKQIEFFKKIILKGDFNEAITFLLTFQNRIEESVFKKIILDIYKQKLCELIENPNEQQLKTLFEKELINYCSEEQFQELFNYLTYRSVNEIQEFQKWTVLRGRYQCFENAIPYLEMFNSVMKPEDAEETLENIIETYYKSKEGMREPFSFNRKNVQPEIAVDSIQKNKSSLPFTFFKGAHQYSSSQGSDQKLPLRQSEGSQKQKEIIKNSVVNMNISGNYSQMKSKLLSSGASNIQNTSKYNPVVSIEENQSKIEKSKVGLPEKSKMFGQQANEKSGIIGEKNPSISDKSIQPSLRESGIGKEKSQYMEEKRPRANANLSGPMHRQKMQGSIKVDNYVKNESGLSIQENTPSSYKNLKIQKSQMLNNNSGNYSQLAKSGKTDKPSFPTKIEPPILYGHLNQMQSSQLNQIQEQDHSETTKSFKNQRAKYSYLNSKNENEDLEEEVRKNIEYLQQTSSVIYNKDELENEGYTFSNNQEEKQFKVSKVVKLAATTDSKAIRTCQFSDSGNLFAVGTNSSILKIFDVQGLFNQNKYQQIVPIYQIDGLHVKSIFCLHWHSSQRSLLTCSNDMNIKLTQISKNFTEHKISIIGKHDSCIRMVKFSPSETRVVSCGDDSVIKVWDLGKIKKCTNLKNHTSSVSAFKIQNQNELYSVSKDQTIKKWDLRVAETVTTSKVQESQLTYIANNTDDIIVSHKNGTVSFFNPSLQLIHAVQIHQEQIRSIEALKKQNTLLTASFDGHIALFNEQNSHEPSYFQHNDNGEDKVVFATFLHSPLHHGFASTSTQGLCHIYSYQ